MEKVFLLFPEVASCAFGVLALMCASSPMLSSAIVVLPTVKSFQVYPLSVEYSSEMDGAEPTACMEMVELACLAVNVSTVSSSTYSHLLTVECVRFAEMSAMS